MQIQVALLQRMSRQFKVNLLSAFAERSLLLSDSSSDWNEYLT